MREGLCVSVYSSFGRWVARVDLTRIHGKSSRRIWMEGERESAKNCRRWLKTNGLVAASVWHIDCCI